MTPSGIEPVTFRFVAQHLNHCATTMKAISCIELPVSLCLYIACRLEIRRLVVRPPYDMHIWQSCLQSCQAGACFLGKSNYDKVKQEKLIKEIVAI